MIDGRRVAFTGDNYFEDVVDAGGKMQLRPYQTTVLRNSFQLGMHRRCIEVMRQIQPELICPGHRDVLACDKQALDAYSDFIHRKERVFRELVHEAGRPFHRSILGAAPAIRLGRPAWPGMRVSFAAAKQSGSAGHLCGPTPAAAGLANVQ